MRQTGKAPVPRNDSKATQRSTKSRQSSLLKSAALPAAILTSANFSIIATDERGIIQLFNVGAESMFGYTAKEVVNKIRLSDMHDPEEIIARPKALSLGLATPVAPGCDALSYKPSSGLEDIYELTCIRKDGARFPAVASVTALRNGSGAVTGYLIIGTDNSVRKRSESALKDDTVTAESADRRKPISCSA
jgi:PAS domain-containing protein